MFAYAASRPSQGKLRDVERTYAIPDTAMFTVRTLPLDSLVTDRRPPDVIKIDVEGAAASVLRGAAVRNELLARGYVAETLDGARVLDPTDGWHSPLWCYRPQAPAPGA